jgi:two-component system chemotaxis response regulator CheY
VPLDEFGGGVKLGKTIMTVDDSASIRQMVSFTLRSEGFEVVEATDGKDALAKLNPSVSLIITDLNMPNMDGIGLIKEVLQSLSYRFLPIVLLTTESQDEKKLEARKAGATGWIVKPFRAEQLIAVVKKVLG